MIVDITTKLIKNSLKIVCEGDVYSHHFEGIVAPM